MNSKQKPKIAVITGMSYLDVDRILAAFVLAKALTRNTDQTVDITLNYSLPKNIFSKLEQDEVLNVVNDITLQNQALKLNNILQEVSDIKWENTEEGLEIELLNVNGERINPENATVTYASANYDKAYLIGVRSQGYLLKMLSNVTTKDLEEVSLTSINVIDKSLDFEAERFFTEDNNSFCGAIYKFAEKQGWELQKQELDQLLAGIYWKTNALRNYYTTKNTFDTIKEIIAEGGKTDMANQIIFASQDLELEKEIWTNTTASGNTAVSKLTTPKNYMQIFDNKLTPVLSPLMALNTKTSLILMALNNSETFVVASTSEADFNLGKQLRKFKPKGDDQFLKFRVQKNIEDTETELLKLLEPNKKQPESTSTREEKPEKSKSFENSKIEPTKVFPEESKPKKVDKKPVESAPVKEKQPEQVSQETKPIQKPRNTDSDDPLAPAEIDFNDLLEEDDEDDSASNSMFGGFGGGNSDPLPAAKS